MKQILWILPIGIISGLSAAGMNWLATINKPIGIGIGLIIIGGIIYWSYKNPEKPLVVEPYD